MYDTKLPSRVSPKEGHWLSASSRHYQSPSVAPSQPTDVVAIAPRPNLQRNPPSLSLLSASGDPTLVVQLHSSILTLTYASLLHHSSLLLSLWTLWSRGPSAGAIVGAILAASSLSARARAEHLGLRKTSLTLCALLALCVGLNWAGVLEVEITHMVAHLTPSSRSKGPDDARFQKPHDMERETEVCDGYSAAGSSGQDVSVHVSYAPLAPSCLRASLAAEEAVVDHAKLTLQPDSPSPQEDLDNVYPTGQASPRHICKLLSDPTPWKGAVYVAGTAESEDEQISGSLMILCGEAGTQSMRKAMEIAIQQTGDD